MHLYVILCVLAAFLVYAKCVRGKGKKASLCIKGSRKKIKENEEYKIRK